MTLRSWRLAAAACVPALIGACGGSTTINFVGEPDNTGGDSMGGDGSGGTESSGGTDVGGMAGDSSSGGGAVVGTGYCGDGSIDDDSEACDDGNEKSHDGCSAGCEVEAPFACNGEPSVCSTMGNGVIDAGEECDDGNTDDDDGCSAEGAVEGECEAPTLLTLVDAGPERATASATADTSAGGGTAPADACGGLLLGAGNDRVFQVTTTMDGDFTVTVDAEFDAILRIYGQEDPGPTCDPGTEAFCIDDRGAGGGEKFQFHGMDSGVTVSIVVDGADEDDEGEFTVTVTEGCIVDHVKLHRLTPFDGDLANTAMLSLKNTSDHCAVYLDTVGVTLTDDYQLVKVDLPQQALAPGEVFRASYDVDPAVNPNAVEFTFTGEPNIFDSVAAGAYLCDGPCDTAEGTNVTDAVLTGTEPNLQIPGTTYLPGQQDVEFSPHQAHVRVAYDGVAPNFLASDWSPAFLIDPDDFLSLDFLTNLDPDVVGADLGPLAVTSDELEGTVLQVPTVLTPGAYSLYAASLPVSLMNPTYISYTTRIPPGAEGTNDGCYLGFGAHPGTLGTVAQWQAATGVDRSYTYEATEELESAAFTNPLSMPEGTWHVVELTNINWTDHTYTVVIDGTPQATTSSFRTLVDTFADVTTIMPWRSTSCQYSDVIVRAGPPGRVWASPPVLP